MKNLFRIAPFFVVFLFISILSLAADWKFDNFLKFQVCYYPTEGLLNLKGDNLIKVDPIGIGQSFAPDISNINLKAFLSLGFNVEKMPDPKKYNFYLKLFKFPTIFKASITTLPIIKDYHLNMLHEKRRIVWYLSDGKNIIVKLGFIDSSERKFTSESPCPSLTVLNDGKFQEIFDDHIPFASMYTIPSKEMKTSTDNNLNAKNSANGNLALHKEVIETYKQNLSEVKGVDGNYLYFMDKDPNDKEIVILKISKDVTVFSNWADLPMPQDPKKIFLSSLALVERDTYSKKKERNSLDTSNLLIESDEFSESYKRTGSSILELASVVYLK